MALDQKNRLLSLATPLGENELVLTGFQGHEEISRLFSFRLEMISDNPNVKAKDIVGKNVTFAVQTSDDSPRSFNGFVSRFSAGDEYDGRRNYRAEVVPWLWFLTRTSDCRIFQNKTAPDIIEQVFGDLGFSDYKLQLTGTHPERDYCVQYRESDFNFVSRLMEEEGMFYYFRHENGKHTMVIADKASAYVECPEKEVDYPTDTGTRAIEDHIKSWEHRYEFCTGKWAQTDFNFETPSTKLMNKSDTVVDLSGTDKFEFYDYPGLYANNGDGKPLTDVRMEEEEATHDVVHAASNCKTFTPGGKFKIRQHQSKSEEGNSYVITSIQHSAIEPQAYETGSGGDFDYKNSFQCIPDSVTIRPARISPKPFVQGVQTAIVVGPAGEEIYPDKYGRVKVQFHWDREGQYDENSSCWMRVSQVHAGKGFGGIDLPRVGEEVIVDFLEGDPDRPIITGRVYHAESMPPFGLPDSKTISGLKSKTYKGEGYNEYVLDDTPGNELIREHGQFDKDSTIENDLREHVLNNRSRDVSVDETIKVGSNQTIDIGSNQTLTVGGNQDIGVSGNQTESVTGSQTVSVGSGRSVSIDGDDTVGATGGMTHQADGLLKLVGNGNVEIKGPQISIVADSEISLTVGGSVMKITSGSIETSTASITTTAMASHDIKGAVVKHNC